jgi:hypothetical protein
MAREIWDKTAFSNRTIDQGEFCNVDRPNLRTLGEKQQAGGQISEAEYKTLSDWEKSTLPKEANLVNFGREYGGDKKQRIYYRQYR